MSATLDADHAKLVIAGKEVGLTPYEACAVLVLQRHKGKYVRHDQLATWMLTARRELGFRVNGTFPVPEAKWQVGNLYRKLRRVGIDPRTVIERKPGWGYRWRDV